MLSICYRNSEIKPMTPCFAAEKTLGKLAKWLRLLGFDTLYEPEVAAEEFIKKLGNDRIVLTRTRLICRQSTICKLIFVHSDHWADQLKQIILELGLKAAQTRPFSRCLHCNIPIVSTEKNSLWGRVPDYIFETHDHFQTCPKCGKVYWSGSHTERGLEMIQKFFE
jgi:uncharacterized protein with PIN domain